MHNTSNAVPIVGRDANGNTVWYTGKAGSEFISTEPRHAFMGYSLEGARNRAKQLNRMCDVHGVWFVACVGELAAEVK